MARHASLITALTLCAIACSQPVDDEAALSTAVVGVSVIDVEAGAVLDDRTVVIRGDRIVSVGPRRDVPVPEGARVVEGAGRFLIPGLWDMHVNMWDERLMRDVLFPSFLAHGVVGVREMGGDTMQLRLRDMITAGQLAGPRMIVGGLVEGVDVVGAWRPYLPVETRADAADAVDSIRALGFDFVKTHDDFLPLPAYRGVLERAQRIGMEVSGHLPLGADVMESATQGHRTIEHLTGIGIACSLRRAELLEAYAEQAAASGSDTARIRLLLRSEVEPLRDFKSDGCRDVYQALREADARVVPTLARREVAALGADASVFSDPDAVLLGGSVESAAFLWEWVPDRMLVPVFNHWLRELPSMNDEGLGILAGTDLPDVVGGQALHYELELMVRGGLTPLDALRTATLEPARYLGASDSLGAVRVGMVADLVLLEGDPLQSISNTRRIVSVIRRGEFYDRITLDEMLVEASLAMDSLRSRVAS